MRPADRLPHADLHVAYLVNQYPKVSHTFIRREIQALERAGLQVQRIALRGWDADVPDAMDRDERSRTAYALRGGGAALVGPLIVNLLQAPGRFFESLRLALRFGRRSDRPLFVHLVYLAEACWILQELRASGARHLHAHFGTNSAEVALLVRTLGGPPYSFTVHGPEEFDKATVLGLAEKIRGSAFTVAISSFGRSQLYRWAASADWPKIKVVHCGLDASFRQASASGPDAGEPAARLICIGRLSEQKGHLLLLEAAARLIDRGERFELVLAGDGELRDDLERTIEARRLQGHVRITGWIDSAQVREELIAARALVLPSFAEGLPVVIMEAMALARPVISTFVAGIPELVRSGVDGWLVPAGDVDALVTAMSECLGQPAAAWRKMGESARARVLERHDVDREALKLVRLFEGAMTPSGSSGESRAMKVEC